MKILVCISHVPDTTSRINFTEENSKFDTNGVQFVINPNDEFGLTKAVWMKESNGANVTVLTVGDLSAETILRKCVHCGMCNATCPTYGINGDELEGPRGRIYLIKDMLENNKPANKKIAQHIDSCLSCYSCMTTCPSGVNYMHLIDHGRNYVEETYKRPFIERTFRNILSFVLPRPKVFLTLAILTKLDVSFKLFCDLQI